MSASEVEIMRFFRRFAARADEMLFFNQTNKPKTHNFASAMRSLIEKGMVVKERPRDAYSLTLSGYRASLVADAT